MAPLARRSALGGRRRAHRHRPAVRSPTCRAGCRASASPPALPRRGRRARRGGLQLPARRRRRDEHGRRLRDVVVGARLRRLRDGAGPRHAAAGPVARRAPRCASPTCSGRDGAPVVASPRQILRAQLDAARRARLDRRRRRPSSSSWSSATPTSEAGQHGYRDLDPREPLQRRLLDARHRARRAAAAADPQRAWPAPGMRVENSKGECNFGQHEINFAYGPVAADRRRALDLQERRQGDRRPGGHGDHLHGQVRRARGQLVPHPPLAARARTAPPCSPTTTRCSTRFLAGQLACLRELSLFFAPNINSYKRFAAGSFAPTAVAWGEDNRTCALRVVGHGPSRRIELRLAGADVNPYLALAGADRRGPARDRRRARLEPAVRGQRLRVGQAARPGHAARGARRCSRPARSRTRRSATEVVEHYLNNARIELQAFQAAVTDWERVRGFERL